MDNLTDNQKSYARFFVSKKDFERGVTAFVKITHVNGEYVEFIDNDEIKYKIAKEKFAFVEKEF